MTTDAERAMAYELADIRGDMLDTLPELARILRYVGDDRSDIEGRTEPYDADTDTVPASLSSTGFSESEQVIADRFRDRPTYVVSLPAHTALKIEDRIRIETRDGAPISPMRTFSVASVPDDTWEWLHRIVVFELK
jgi:hypothetical protein